MKNKLNLYLLLIAIFFSSNVMAERVLIDGIYYDINKKDATAYVSYRSYDYDDFRYYNYYSKYEGDIVIQSSFTYEDVSYSVTGIDSYAFANCSGITSVTIPDGLTYIGKYVFYDCSSLTSLVIPNSVTYIGDFAFCSCSGLTSLAIPNSVTYIKDYAFSGCSGLTSLVIPNSVTSIGNNAFQYCSGLTSLAIPNSVTSIGDYAFQYCSGLTSLAIPNSVTSIGDYAFSGCSGLTSIYLPNASVGSDLFGIKYDDYKTIESIYCYPKAYSSLKKTYGSRLKLIGAPVLDAVYKGKTQFTLSFKLKESDCFDVPKGYDSIELTEKGIIYYDYFQTTVKAPDTDDITISDLRMNTYYYVRAYAKYSDGFTYYGDKVEYTTNGLGLQLSTAAVGPTHLKVVGSYTEGDATVTETGFTNYGKGDVLNLTGLVPNTKYKIVYYVNAKEGKETKEITVTTPALELTTLAPKVVSSTCAVVAATTNIGEEETGVGFQWKKYDAPASLAPSEGYAAIYDGQLEGYIKNLQSTSFYNVRAFYKSAADKYHYGEWITFDPSDFSYFEPTVHTYPVQEISTSHAKLKGYVMAGTDEITEQGFEYWPLGTSESKARRVFAAVAADGVSVVLATGQVMTAVIDELTPGTTYCYRAFVRTAGGTTYGEEQTFATEAGTTGISDAMTDGAEPAVIGYYDMNGRKQNDLQKGLNIIRYSDGSARKVIVK